MDVDVYVDFDLFADVDVYVDVDVDVDVYSNRENHGNKVAFDRRRVSVTGKFSTFLIPHLFSIILSAGTRPLIPSYS